jgi:hypothetical protein
MIRCTRHLRRARRRPTNGAATCASTIDTRNASSISSRTASSNCNAQSALNGPLSERQRLAPDPHKSTESAPEPTRRRLRGKPGSGRSVEVCDLQAAMLGNRRNRAFSRPKSTSLAVNGAVPHSPASRRRSSSP